MKRLLLTTAMLALTAGAALAADLPSRKAQPVYMPPPPPPPLWTGFYAGLNAGYGFGTSTNARTAGIPTYDNVVAWDEDDYGSSLGLGLGNSGVANLNQNGFVGGGQIGYNYQISSFVLGLEADIQGSAIRGQGGSHGVGVDQTVYEGAPYLQRTTFGGTSVSAGVDWFGTVRGRLGYLVTPTLLAYGTGGLTYGGVHANSYSAFTNNYSYVYPGVTDPQSFSTTSAGIGSNRSSTRAGWNVGGGLEWMFMPNWSLKAEAFYYNLGSQVVASYAIAGGQTAYNSDSPTTAVTTATRVNYQGVIARAGVNYHFNWGAAAPVVAKY